MIIHLGLNVQTLRSVKSVLINSVGVRLVPLQAWHTKLGVEMDFGLSFTLVHLCQAVVRNIGVKVLLTS